MNSQLAEKLVNKLKEKCPVDTGQLKFSIQMIQLDANNWEVLIGNASGNINGTPSEKYASITNFNATLGKNKKKNENYRWVNKEIIEWAFENMLAFEMEGEDDE